MRLRLLQLVGSPTSRFFCELSELYARGCIEALAEETRFEFVIAHVSPDGTWRFPDTLDAASIARAPAMGLGPALSRIDRLATDAALPQMFCHAGMTAYRGLLDVLGLAYLGNAPTQMALAADKSLAKAVVAAAGVAVPAGERLDAHTRPTLALPLVIKPNAADNSDGIALVRKAAELDAALAAARAHGQDVIAERYIPLGREVRCGVIERDGGLVGLPLEEYNVDTDARPVRRRDDKLQRSGNDQALNLAAKDAASSWIVDASDSITHDVHEAAKTCHRALGLRHYGLFDFRIDPDGRPWFLEAGPYCSFAPGSVVATMMRARGEALATFLARSLADWLDVGRD